MEAHCAKYVHVAFLFVISLVLLNASMVHAAEYTQNDASATFQGENIGDDFGTAISSGGDVNGDGIDDVLMAARSVEEQSGVAYVFFGQKIAFSGSISPDAYDMRFSYVQENDEEDDFFTIGAANVSVLYDMNGDGIDEIAIGDRGAYASAGAVYIFYGESDGDINDNDIADSQETIDATTADRIIIGAGNDYALGGMIVNLGDVNNDGFGDYAFGVPSAEGGGAGRGDVHIFYGQEDDDSVQDVVSAEESNAILYGTDDYNSFPSGLSGGHDINNDGIDDFVIGNEEDDVAFDRAGALYIFYGQNGTDPVTGTHVARSVADEVIDGKEDNGFLGNAVGLVSDVNADGIADIVSGAQFAGENGEVYVFYGSADGFGARSDDADATIAGSCSCAMGGDIVDLGDFNGDGHNDLGISEVYANLNKGYLYLFNGDENGIAGLMEAYDADDQFTSLNAGDYLPDAVTVGDVDHDGALDLLISVLGNSEELDEVFVFYGADIETKEPTLILPGTNTFDSTLNISYSLPEAPLTGSVTLTFDDGSTPTTLTMIDDTDVAMGLFANDLAAHDAVVSASAQFLEYGTYTVTLGYQDAASNEEKVAVAYDVGFYESIPLATELTRLSHQRVAVAYDVGPSKEFTLFETGAKKAKATLHTNGRVIIAISKRYIRTFDAYTGVQIDQKKLFKKKQGAVKMKRFHLYEDKEANTVVVLARKSDGASVRIRTFQIGAEGAIRRRNIQQLSATTHPRELVVAWNGLYDANARISVEHNEQVLESATFAVRKNGSTVAAE